MAKSLEAVISKLRKRTEARNEVRANGGNEYQAIKTFLTDPETGKRVGGDMTAYAIQQLTEPEKVESFIKGYIAEMRESKPTCLHPAEKVKWDIYDALQYFYNPSTHKLWKGILEKYE